MWGVLKLSEFYSVELILYTELYAVYFSPNIIRVIKARKQMGRTCRVYGERSSANRILVGEISGKETTWNTQA
jgi:hypothetical protein